MNEPDLASEPEGRAADDIETGADALPAGSDPASLKHWLEAALLAAGQPLTLNQLNALFPEAEQPGHGPLREALALLDAELGDRAVELVEVAGGYRLQIRSRLMPVVSNLWAEKPPKYSRALLETLAIIAYRQPITRGEIEQIRGVSLSANILKTLQEREWIKVVGHRDMPGKPELLGTTKAFLDYFGLKGLDDLPTLAEIRDLDNIEPELDLKDPDQPQAANDDRARQEDKTHQIDPEPERRNDEPEAGEFVEDDDQAGPPEQTGPDGEEEVETAGDQAIGAQEDEHRSAASADGQQDPPEDEPEDEQEDDPRH